MSFRDVIQTCNDLEKLDHLILMIYIKVHKSDSLHVQIWEQHFSLQGMNGWDAIFYYVRTVILLFFFNKTLPILYCLS